MDLIVPVAENLRLHIGVDTAPRILIAVSGGPDSVALLDLLARLRQKTPLDLGIAHLNYRLRADDSDEDALFVKDLADSYDIPVSVRTISPVETDTLKISGLQERARVLRYQFFDDVCARDGYHFVALGHHRDDQVETFFAHLFRGAGSEGLRGMRILSQEKLFRPLLSHPREDILEYLNRRCLPFREDSTNEKSFYLRNRLRHDLLPAIRRDHGAQALRSIASAMEILAAESELIEQLAADAVPTLLLPATGDETSLDRVLFGKLPLALQRRAARIIIIKATGRVPSFRLVEQFVWLATQAGSGAAVDVGAGARARRQYERITIARETPLAIDGEIPLTIGVRETLADDDSWVLAEEVNAPANPQYSPQEYAGDWDLVRFPVTLRRPRSGDVIAPLGLGGHHKTVSRYFKDAKVPLDVRRRTWVLADSERVLWIVGYVVSEETKVTAKTTRVLRVSRGPI